MTWTVFGEEGHFWKPAPRDTSHARNSIRVGLLPVYFDSYAESIPCDSCRWLSRSGAEFALEHALLRGLDSAWETSEVDRILPHTPLWSSGGDTLGDFRTDLVLPWQTWFGDSTGRLGTLVWRPRDFFSTPGSRALLDSVGGRMGLDFLVVTQGASLGLKPRSSTSHRGDLSLAFQVAAYDVVGGRFVWALRYRKSLKNADLNQSWEPWIAELFQAANRVLPVRIREFRDAEPR